MSKYPSTSGLCHHQASPPDAESPQIQYQSEISCILSHSHPPIISMFYNKGRTWIHIVVRFLIYILLIPYLYYF